MCVGSPVQGHIRQRGSKWILASRAWIGSMFSLKLPEEGQELVWRGSHLLHWGRTHLSSLGFGVLCSTLNDNSHQDQILNLSNVQPWLNRHQENRDFPQLRVTAVSEHCLWPWRSGCLTGSARPTYTQGQVSHGKLSLNMARQIEKPGGNYLLFRGVKAHALRVEILSTALPWLCIPRMQIYPEPSSPALPTKSLWPWMEWVCSLL